jgi:hypothetical protein
MPVAKKGAAAPKKSAISVASHISALNKLQKLKAGASASVSVPSFEEAMEPKNWLKKTSSNAYLQIDTEEGTQIKIWASTFERCFEWDDEQELFTLIEGARVGKSGDVYPPDEA